MRRTPPGQPRPTIASSLPMTTDDPHIDELKRRQLEQEEAERDEIGSAVSEAEADRHRRRADKARYLREKLEERERADRQAAEEPDR